jgi:hypothetical protein
MRKPLSDKQKYQAAARDLYHKCGELEIDDDPAVSAGEDPGAYVAAWVWVSNEEAGVQPEYWHPKSIWDDHPTFPVEDWRYECANDDTRLGYIAWVNGKLTDEVDTPMAIIEPSGTVWYFELFDQFQLALAGTPEAFEVKLGTPELLEKSGGVNDAWEFLTAGNDDLKFEDLSIGELQEARLNGNV